MTGIVTTQLPLVSILDEVLGNRGGSTARISISRLAAAVAASIGPSYATRAELFADLDWPDGAQGYVRGDSTPEYRGVYRKSGATGGGAWERIGDLLPPSVTGLLVSEDLEVGAATWRMGYDWTVLGSPIVLTSGASPAELPGAAVSGTFSAMRGGLATVGVEIEISAAAPRMIRLTMGAGGGPLLADQALWLIPGAVMRVTAVGQLSDFGGGITTLNIQPEAEAVGLLSGETVTITAATATRVYWKR